MKQNTGYDFPFMPEGDIMEDLEYAVKKRSYPSKNDRERLVDEKFQVIADAMEKNFGGRDVEGMGYTGEILSRRKAAVCNYIEKALKECPNAVEKMISIEETIAGFEAGPSRTTYDGLDMQEYILMAASIWILDDLKRNGRIYDAYEFLPQDYNDIISMDTPMNFYDPCFDVDLIQSVMSVIHNRNRQHGDGMRFWQSLNDPCDAGARKPGAKESEDRRNFEGLMSLIDHEHAKAAGNAFKDRVWDAMKRYIDAMLVLDRQDVQAVQRARQSGYGQPSVLMVNPNMASEHEVMLAFKDALETLDETNRVRRDMDLEFEDLIGMDVGEVKVRIGSARAAKKVAGFTIDDPYEICFGLLYLMDQGDDAPWLFHTGYCVLWNAAKLLPWFEPFEQKDDDGAFEELDDWDDWDDGALVYNKGEWIQRQDELGSEDKTDYYHEMHGGKNLAQILFEMTGAVVPRNLHPFEEKRKELKESGMDKALVDKVIAQAEIFFLSQFQSKAKNFEGRKWYDFVDDEESAALDDAEDGVEGTNDADGRDSVAANDAANEQVTKTVKATGYWGAVAEKQGLSIEKDVPNTTATVKENVNKEEGGKVMPHVKHVEQAQNISEGDKSAERKAAEKRLKEENKGLRKALSELSRQSAQEKAKLEREMKELRWEHRELADLRELVFNQENDIEGEDSGQGTETISFPYETQKRTVVFGGHESFLKKFKPKFTNVRFVDADQYAFSQDLIRNADVIWIQNNHISHAQFNRIINTARQYGIQVRYFAYPSADKCAEVLAKEDIKG